MVYIAEIRRGFLSKVVIGVFKTCEEAEKALKTFKRENPGILGPEDFYEINCARLN
jgi:hypothetical protein